MDVRLSLRGFHSDWDAPGYLNQAKYEQDRRQAVSETNGGRKNRLEGRVDLDDQLSTDAKLLFNVWGYNQEFRRYYANDPEGLADDTVVGNLRIFKRDVFGAGASYNYLGAVVNRPLNLIIGADFMVEDDGRERWHLLAGSGREKGPKFWETEFISATENPAAIPESICAPGWPFGYYDGSCFNKKYDGPAIIHPAGHTREPHLHFQIEGRLQPGFAARKSKMVVLGVAALLLAIPAGAHDLCLR